MIPQQEGELDFADERHFHLIDYRLGHSYAVVRGMPEPDEDDVDGDVPPRVIDFFFAGASRISLWKDFVDFHIRRPTDEERSVLEDRIGPLREDDGVYLLEAGTIETHIVASRVFWAEFDLHGGAPSPLAVEDPDYRAAHPPVGGVIRFAD
ncbi:hypothetical protein ACIA8K_08000 [Catenuloplanes sp. NPDC051500]|uniref:hypothetical protein n=1 Tax=Catenuloplanes sp. NPDC051500 TaxID=3363959 RepID=UPI00379D26B1